MNRPSGEEGRASAVLARGVATLFGIGYVPGAPGSAASAAGLLLYWLLYQGSGLLPLLALAVVVPAAVWSGGAQERMSGRKDPPEVVADELAGQLLCLLGAPPTLLHLASGFIAFRLFDILKPVPLRRLEALAGGWGIVADDLLAGAMGWVVLAAGRSAGLL